MSVPLRRQPASRDGFGDSLGDAGGAPRADLQVKRRRSSVSLDRGSEGTAMRRTSLLLVLIVFVLPLSASAKGDITQLRVCGASGCRVVTDMTAVHPFMLAIINGAPSRDAPPKSPYYTVRPERTKEWQASWPRYVYAPSVQMLRLQRDGRAAPEWMWFGRRDAAARRLIRGLRPFPATMASSAVTLQLRGFGQSVGSSDVCPDGQTVIRIVGSSRSVFVCVTSVRKLTKPGIDPWRIVQSARVTTPLPGGALRTAETQTFTFTRSGASSAVFRGRVIGGTGRYADVTGTVSGGGKGRNGVAVWRVTFRLR